MPEILDDKQHPTGIDTDESFRQAVHDVVVGVEGVTRVEPSLLGRLRKSMAAVEEHLPDLGGHGIEVISRDGVVSVAVDIAVQPTCSARDVGAAVQQAVVSMAASWGVQVESVAVSVLTIESTHGGSARVPV